MSSNTWFAADFHFGHEKVSQLRGFSTVEEHDTTISNNIRSVVSEGDNIFVIGDISGGKSEDYALNILRQLKDETKANFHLVCGNHDSVHPMHSQWMKKWGKFSEVFDTITTQSHTKINKQKVLISHFPYNGDHRDERYSEWRMRDTGVPIIHGHTHSRDKISVSPEGTTQLCVSIDAWNLTPVNKDSIVRILMK